MFSFVEKFKKRDIIHFFKGVASSDLEFPETPAYSSTNVVRGGAFQDNHQGKYCKKKINFVLVINIQSTNFESLASFITHKL